MNYILSTKVNNYNIVNYEHEISPDYALFTKGISVKEEVADQTFYFSPVNQSAVKKLTKFHWLSSTGPDLVSDEFKKVIEEIAPTEVEFFNAEILIGEEKINDFYVLNIKHKIECFNMKDSEFKLTNFDPQNPAYRFYYMVASDKKLEYKVVRSKEAPGNIVVDDTFMEHCIKASLKGLLFCNAIDLTPQARSNCFEIK